MPRSLQDSSTPVHRLCFLNSKSTITSGLKKGELLANAVNYARDLVNIPAVDLTPKEEQIIFRGYHKQWLNDARDMAKEFIILAYHSYVLLSVLNPDEYKINIKTNMNVWDHYFNVPFKETTQSNIDSSQEVPTVS